MAKGERKRVTHERRNSFLLPTTAAEAKLADSGTLSPITDGSGNNTPAPTQSYFPINGHAHPPAPHDSGIHQRGGTSPRGELSGLPPPPAKSSYAPAGGWNDLPASFGTAPPPRPQPNGRHPSPAPPAAPTPQLV